MRLEYKFERISNDPEEINRVIETDSAWGWQVVNLQVIDSKAVYRGNTYGVMTQYGSYSVSEVVHDRTTYTNITYSRDVEEPRYKRWHALEEEYEQSRADAERRVKEIREYNEARGKEQAKKYCILNLAIAILSVVLAVVFIPFRVIFCPFAVICAILSIVSVCSGTKYANALMNSDPDYQQFLVDMRERIIPAQERLVEEGLNL